MTKALPDRNFYELAFAPYRIGVASHFIPIALGLGARRL